MIEFFKHFRTFTYRLRGSAALKVRTLYRNLPHVVTLLALYSCADIHNAAPDTATEIEKGTLSFDGMAIEIPVPRSRSVSGTVSPENFIVTIYNAGILTNPVVTLTYGEALTQGTVELRAGEYELTVTGGELFPAAFEAPYYTGRSGKFTIRPKEVSVLSTIECTIENVAVEIKIDDALLGLIEDINTLSVKAANSAEHTLTYGIDHLSYNGKAGIDGYFSVNENDFTAEFQAVMDGNEVSMRSCLPPLEKGYRYTVTYSATGSGIVPVPGQGTPGGNFSIDVTVERKEIIDVKFDGEPDKPYDGEIHRPGEDDDTDKTPEIPGEDDKPVQPDTAIEFASDHLNLESINIASEFVSNNWDAVLKISAKAGIRNLFVDIYIPDESFSQAIEELIPLNFDLAHLDESHKGTFSKGDDGLGLLPEDGIVEGKTSVDFDITAFMALMGNLGSGIKVFTITVVDVNGISKEAVLRIE